MQKKNRQLKPFAALILLFGGVSLIAALDQIIKYKIRHLGGFYICNPGISFGLSLSPVIFWLILSFFLFLFIFYLKNTIQKGSLSVLLALSFGLLVGGALSNIIDRLFFGCIFDFISLRPLPFPLFNVADMSIFIGSLLFSFLLFLKNNSVRV